MSPPYAAERVRRVADSLGLRRPSAKTIRRIVSFAFLAFALLQPMLSDARPDPCATLLESEADRLPHDRSRCESVRAYADRGCASIISEHIHDFADFHPLTSHSLTRASQYVHRSMILASSLINWNLQHVSPLRLRRKLLEHGDLHTYTYYALYHAANFHNAPVFLSVANSSPQLPPKRADTTPFAVQHIVRVSG